MALMPNKPIITTTIMSAMPQPGTSDDTFSVVPSHVVSEVDGLKTYLSHTIGHIRWVTYDRSHTRQRDSCKAISRV